VDANKIRINTLALGARLPTMHGFREYVEAAGLMSYGANLPDLYLSLLKIISERNNDAIRTELASRQWFRIVAPLEVSVSL